MTQREALFLYLGRRRPFNVQLRGAKLLFRQDVAAVRDHHDVFDSPPRRAAIAALPRRQILAVEKYDRIGWRGAILAQLTIGGSGSAALSAALPLMTANARSVVKQRRAAKPFKVIIAYSDLRIIGATRRH